MKHIILAALVGVLVNGPVGAKNEVGYVCGNLEYYAFIGHHRLSFLSKMPPTEIKAQGLKKEYDDLVYIRMPNIIQMMKNLDCDMDALKDKLDKIACDAIRSTTTYGPCPQIETPPQ